MGKINIKDEVLKENPRGSLLEIKILSDALATYREAQENIERTGVICSHPKTGAPLENPYVKVRASQVGIIQKFSHLKTNETLRLLEVEASKKAKA